MGKKNTSEKPFFYGGQAVMEGVMMRGKTAYAIAVRAQDGKIKIERSPVKGSKKKFLKLPLVRGVVAFIDSLFFGMQILMKSADMAGIDLTEENPSKFDMWLEKKFGDSLVNVVMVVSVVLGLALAIGIFMLLPALLASLLNNVVPAWALGIIEGIVRIALFLCYIAIVANMRDVRRVFEYHGAEHKTINCNEMGIELTVENVAKQTRLNKRCGTSFLIIVMIVSMIIFAFVVVKTVWLRVLSRLVLVPLIAGLSYEIIRLAGKYDNALIRAISAPGLALQKLTTKEPDDEQIAVGIASLNAVLYAEGVKEEPKPEPPVESIGEDFGEEPIQEESIEDLAEEPLAEPGNVF